MRKSRQSVQYSSNSKSKTKKEKVCQSEHQKERDRERDNNNKEEVEQYKEWDRVKTMIMVDIQCNYTDNNSKIQSMMMMSHPDELSVFNICHYHH